MADPTLAVLLRNGPHNGLNVVRYALKCSDIAISYARTPMQIPIAQADPELIDLGFMRPSLTCTGVVDTVGEDSTNTGNATGAAFKGYAGMASFLYVRPHYSIGAGVTAWQDGGSNNAQRYFVPCKNALEEAVGSWIYDTDTQLQIEIGDARWPIATYDGFLDAFLDTSRYESSSTYYHASGGAIYDVAIQQGRFSMQAAREDRYDFTLQFVIKRRVDIPE